MSLDMTDEEDGKDDCFLEMSHCGLGPQSGVKSLNLNNNSETGRRRKESLPLFVSPSLRFKRYHN